MVNPNSPPCGRIPALQPGNASTHCTTEGQPQDAHREEAHREDVAPHRLRATDASEGQAIDVKGEDFHEAEEAGQIHRPRHLAGTHRLQFLVPICRTRLTNQKGYRTQCCSTVAVSAQFPYLFCANPICMLSPQGQHKPQQTKAWHSAKALTWSQ